MERKSYVYKITCKITGEFYFGSSFNAKRDWYWGGGSKIRERVAQYGKENFIKEILGEFDDRVEAHKVENNYIEKFRNNDKCLNQMLNRQFGSFNEETCEKMSAAQRGKHLSDETRAKIGAANAISQRGKTLSEEHRAKISASLKGLMSGDKNPMYGKNFSKEHRSKLSASHRGKTLSEEHKARIGAFNRGKIVSYESRAKMSASHRGKTLSEETKQKIREYRRGKTPWNKGKKLNKETGEYE